MTYPIYNCIFCGSDDIVELRSGKSVQCGECGLSMTKDEYYAQKNLDSEVENRKLISENKKIETRHFWINFGIALLAIIISALVVIFF